MMDNVGTIYKGRLTQAWMRYDVPGDDAIASHAVVKAYERFGNINSAWLGAGIVNSHVRVKYGSTERYINAH